MKVYILIIFIAFGCVFSERRNDVVLNGKNEMLKFIKYHDFELAMESDSGIEQVLKDFNLLSILLLDSTKSEVLFKYDSELKTNFHYALAASELTESTVGFRTECETLEGVLKSKRSLNMIFDCIYGEYARASSEYRIINPVYINGNVAVVEIANMNVFSQFFIKLDNGIVHINLLESTIEN
ncbi:hypothetical protein [Dyadobacter bucti]|uniref:hypothetical protein n=1 Tax=Dyadobacter bucti TaxID=2572203 RepID=UPI003F700E2D